MEKEGMYEVLNPRGMPPKVKRTPLNPRPGDLSGKVVYCISQHIGGADTFQRKVVEQLAKYAPGVKAIYRDKKTQWMDPDPELWDEVRAKANAVIYAAAA